MPTISDFIFGPGTSIGVVPGAFVRFTNNVTAAQFTTAAPTSALGLYTTPNIPPGTYTVATGPTAAGPFTTYDPNYVVGDTPGDHVLTSGATPTISGINAGISGTPSIAGNDQAGFVTFNTTASAPAANTNLFTVNFALAYAFAPIVLLTSQSGAGGLSLTFSTAIPTVAAFPVINTQALPNSVNGFVVGYWIVQPRVS